MCIRDRVYGGMLNAIGLQNPGIDVFLKRDIPFLQHYDTKIIVNAVSYTHLHGTLATPFVTTAPKRFRSTKSPYSIPEPNVPDAVITGFLRVTPAIVTLVFI